jgi:hypothetical protein
MCDSDLFRHIVVIILGQARTLVCIGDFLCHINGLAKSPASWMRTAATVNCARGDGGALSQCHERTDISAKISTAENNWSTIHSSVAGLSMMLAAAVICAFGSSNQLSKPGRRTNREDGFANAIERFILGHARSNTCNERAAVGNRAW